MWVKDWIAFENKELNKLNKNRRQFLRNNKELYK